MTRRLPMTVTEFELMVRHRCLWCRLLAWPPRLFLWHIERVRARILRDRRSDV